VTPTLESIVPKLGLFLILPFCNAEKPNKLLLGPQYAKAYVTSPSATSKPQTLITIARSRQCTMATLSSCTLFHVVVQVRDLLTCGHCGNHPFWYNVNHLLLKRNSKALVRGQTIVQDLPFLHTISRRSICTFVLTYRTLGAKSAHCCRIFN